MAQSMSVIYPLTLDFFYILTFSFSRLINAECPLGEATAGRTLAREMPE